MACNYTQNSKEAFDDDLQNIHKGPTLLGDKKQQEFQSPTKKAVKLNRGGTITFTQLGPVQFGLPPETVKDSMLLGIEVPSYYIIPSNRFDKKFGINVAEFEFPAYFNFFVKKRQVTLICDEDTAESIRVVFQETLLGPRSFENIHLDYHESVPANQYIDFAKELQIFANDPFKPTEKLTIDTLIRFKIFKDERVEIVDGENSVVIIRQENQFLIYEGERLRNNQEDNVEFPKEYQKYIEIHKPKESLKAEREPLSVEVIRRISNGKKPPSLTIHNGSDDDVQDQQIKRSARPSVLVWNQLGQATVSQDSQVFDNKEFSFTAPDFGVTVLGCSHGFDPKGSTSGYIFWINGRGVMVDPPPYTSYHLKKMGIAPIMIGAIIISHCHADHDAGAFHKILDDTKVEIITTRTIMYSFLRKYSAISGMTVDQLKNLFIFRPAIIGAPVNVYGATFEFFYALHSIPCIGFRVKVQNKSVYFSGDTYYDPPKLKDLLNKGLINEHRFKQLTELKFNEDLILHEAGVPPIHTPQAVLASLPGQIKNRLYLVHVAQKDLLPGSGLKIAKAGVENTILLIRPKVQSDISMMRRMDLISRIDIFDQLSLTNAKWLLDSLVPEYFSKGEMIVEEFDQGTKFYIIEAGLAKVFSNSKQNTFERYLQVGDYFGESALIDQSKRKASVEAITDLTVLSLERHDFWFIFGDGFEGQGPIIQKLIRLMAARKNQAIHVIFKNSSFSQLTPSQKTQMEMLMFEREVKKGEVMWKVGDKAEIAFFIRRGCFEFVDCPEAQCDEFDSGAFICEFAALMNNTLLTTSIRATRDGSIFTVQKPDIIQFLNRNPGLSLLFQDQKYIE